MRGLGKIDINWANFESANILQDELITASSPEPVPHHAAINDLKFQRLNVTVPQYSIWTPHVMHKENRRLYMGASAINQYLIDQEYGSALDAMLLQSRAKEYKQ